MNTRVAAERDFRASFSRYIGYTKGAYKFSRFVEILNHLSDKAATYRFEIVEKIQALDKAESLSQDYATGVLEFVEAFGLLTNVTGERGSQLNPKLVKYEISDIGRALRSAVGLDMVGFRNYLIGLVLAEKDSDMYCLVLQYHTKPREIDIQAFVKRRLVEIREDRVNWINKNVKYRALRNSIVNQVQWLTTSGSNVMQSNKEIPSNTLRHHVSPRKGWAKENDHIDLESKLLSDHGHEYFSRLSYNGEYSWIWPSEKIMKKLKYDSYPEKVILGPPSKLLRSHKMLKLAGLSAESSDYTDSYLQKIRCYMEEAYPYLKLASANQASTGCIELFCHYLEFSLNVIIDFQEVVESVIKANSGVFAAISSRSARVGHYQLRNFS